MPRVLYPILDPTWSTMRSSRTMLVSPAMKARIWSTTRSYLTTHEDTQADYCSTVTNGSFVDIECNIDIYLNKMWSVSNLWRWDCVRQLGKTILALDPVHDDHE